jgi:hypothetical protein
MLNVSKHLSKLELIDSQEVDTRGTAFPMQTFQDIPELREFNNFLRFDTEGAEKNVLDLAYNVKIAKCTLLQCILHQEAIITAHNHGSTINFDHVTYAYFYYTKYKDGDVGALFVPGYNIPICTLLEQIRNLATQLQLIKPVPGSSIPILTDLGVQALIMERDEPFIYAGHPYFDPECLYDFLKMSLSFTSDQIVLFTAINEPAYIRKGFPLFKALKHRVKIARDLYFEQKVSFEQAAKLAGMPTTDFITSIHSKI